MKLKSTSLKSIVTSLIKRLESLIPPNSQHPLVIPSIIAVLLFFGIGLGVEIGHVLKPQSQPAHVTPLKAMAVSPPEPTPQTVQSDDLSGPPEVTPEIIPVPKPNTTTANTAKERPSQLTWIRNAVPFKGEYGRPHIVIVIDDLGLDKARARQVINLPGPLTLSFMTYAEDLANQTTMAHEHGHELMVHMPMQALSDHFNAGPNVLEVGMDEAQIHQRIAWGLDRFQGYVGVNNHMGSRFTADEAGMNVVMQEMKQRGLLFLDSVTTNVSVVPILAKKYGVPYAQRQVFLDNEETLGAIQTQLAKTEALARQHGQAIAIGHPHDTTIAALTQWLPTLHAKGFDLVPLSTLVKAHPEP